jgi:hypothetical protein
MAGATSNPSLCSRQCLTMLLTVFGDYCLRSAVLGGARIRPAYAADSRWAFLRSGGKNIIRARTERNLSKIAHSSRPHRSANSAYD